MVTAADWDKDEIGSLFSLHRTVALSRAQLSDAAEIGYIHYGDIHSKWGTHLDLSLQALPRVGVGLAASAALVAEGDLVLADASEDLDGVGRAVEICGVGDQRVVAGLHTVLLRPRAGVFASRFVGYLPATPEFRSQARTLAAGLKVYGLSKSSLRQIVVRVPPLKEQEAIAEALGDADAAIELLDALIAKKRDVKEAAMQQLLAGRTRLPGFSGDWREIRLGDHGTFSKGQGIKKDEVVASGLPCIRYGQIYTEHSDWIRSFTAFISPAIAQASRRLVPGELLFTGSGETAAEIGKCVAFLGDEEAYAGGDIVILTPRSLDPKFMGYALNSPVVVQQKMRLAQGDAVVHISSSSLATLSLLVPPLAEQQAIAEVLSDMDTELEALVAERDKMRLVKEGMMQELLSGRVRLV
jgi:type I restriction enzyme S subunit